MNVDYYSEYPETYLMGNLLYEDLQNRTLDDEYDIIQIIGNKDEDNQIRFNIKKDSEITIRDNIIRVKTDNVTQIANLDVFENVVVW